MYQKLRRELRRSGGRVGALEARDGPLEVGPELGAHMWAERHEGVDRLPRLVELAPFELRVSEARDRRGRGPDELGHVERGELCGEVVGGLLVSHRSAPRRG